MSRMMKLMIVALVAVFAFCGIAAGSAFAESEFLVKTGGKFPVSFTGEGGLAELNTLKHKIECKDVRVAGQILTATLVDAEFDFLGCTTIGPFSEVAECQSGTTKGLILTPGYSIHLGKLITLSNGKKDVLILVLVTSTKFKCSTSIESTVTVSGNLVGLLTEESEFNKFGHNQEFEFKQTSAGKQELQTFESGSETHSALHLQSNVEPTKENEEASEVATGKITTTTEEVELMA